MLHTTGRPLLAALLGAAVLSANAAGTGMVTMPSNHDVATTADRLERVLEQKGMKVFARIDHAAAGAGVGETLRPTTLVLFGNPKVGTKLMQCAQTAGIDLPMKALIWEGAGGKVWLGYNDTAWLDNRHGLGECKGVLAKVRGALAGFGAAATAP